MVVGSSSFGKGTVQTVIKLPNQGELTVTWARFHAPSGYALHRRGVLPDICTTGEITEADEVLTLIRTGALPLAEDLRRRAVDTNDDQAVEALRANCPTREEETEVDLQVAKRLLLDPSLYARALQGMPDTAKVDTGQRKASGGLIHRILVLDRGTAGSRLDRKPEASIFPAPQ